MGFNSAFKGLNIPYSPVVLDLSKSVLGMVVLRASNVKMVVLY